MTSTNIIVDYIAELSVPPKKLSVPYFISIKFESGQIAQLNMSLPYSKVWSDIMNSRWSKKKPIYVEIDPANIITKLLLPIRAKIGDIIPVNDDEKFEVELITSHSLHYLKRSNPKFTEIWEVIRDSKKERIGVLVTETLDEHEIIDIRPMHSDNSAKKVNINTAGKT